MNDSAPWPSDDSSLSAESPWPGLASYDEAARFFFCGRAAETEELLRRIKDEPLTVLFGKSGLGKTSLLKAGVFPRLREQGILPILVRLQFGARATPLMEQVRLQLFHELSLRGVDYPEPRDRETLWEYLHRPCLELWTAQNRLVQPLFVFDQFEEVFTLGRAVTSGIAAFRESFADFVENRIPAVLAHRPDDALQNESIDVRSMPYKLVIALREDFLADLEGWRVTMPSLRRNRMRVLPMSTQQAYLAVYNQRTAHLVSEAMARSIVEFVAADNDASGGASHEEPERWVVEPALLSLFCHGINKQRKRVRKACIDLELLEGGKATIVLDFYRTSLADQPERVQHFIEEHLVTEQGFRNSYSVDDALGRGLLTAAELETLFKCRLIRLEHHLGTDRLELTHDLLTKPALEERTRRRNEQRAATDEKRRHKARLIYAGLTAALLGAIVGVGWFAGVAANQKKLARSRALAAFAMANIDEEPEVAVVLARRALELKDTAEARSALLAAGQYVWPVIALEPRQLNGEAHSVALDADGGRLAVVAGNDASRTVSLWNLAAAVSRGTQPDTKPIQAAPRELDKTNRTWIQPLEYGATGALRFSPDAKWLAVGGNSAVRLLDVESGALKRTLDADASNSDEGYERLTFSPDGKWLAALEENLDRAVLWNLGHADPAPAYLRLDGDGGEIALGPDARTVVVVVVENNGLAPVRYDRIGEAWTRAPEVKLPACTLGAISSATTGFSVSYGAGTCFQNIGPESGTMSIDSLQIEDIVWSSGGHALAKLLHDSHDIVASTMTGVTTGPESWIKNLRLNTDAHVSVDYSYLGGVISVSEDANRLALLRVDGQVQVYGLSHHKIYLSQLFKPEIYADGTRIRIRKPWGDQVNADLAIDPALVPGSSDKGRAPSVPVSRALGSDHAPSTMAAGDELRTGRFELHVHPISEKEDEVQVVRRGTDTVVARLMAKGGSHNEVFSSDDRWLAFVTMSRSYQTDAHETQVVDLERGELAFTLNTKDFPLTLFVANNTILEMRLKSGGAMLVPLELDLLKRFAHWLVPRGLTRDEECRYGVRAEAECRKPIVSPKPKQAGLDALRRRLREIALTEHAKGVAEIPDGTNRDLKVYK